MTRNCMDTNKRVLLAKSPNAGLKQSKLVESVVPGKFCAAFSWSIAKKTDHIENL